MAAREALERGVDQAGRKARSVVRQLRTGRTVDVGPELAEQDRPGTGEDDREDAAERHHQAQADRQTPQWFD